MSYLPKSLQTKNLPLAVFCIVLLQWWPYIHGSAYSLNDGGSQCLGLAALRTCQLCGAIFEEVEVNGCCNDATLNSLCHSFVKSIQSTSDPKHRKNAADYLYGGLRPYKKSRNTFLGKRMMPLNFDYLESDSDFDNSDMRSNSNSDGEVMSSTLDMSADKRLNRNNFLGKRVTRSAGNGPRDESQFNQAHLLKAVLNQLVAELLSEPSRLQRLKDTPTASENNDDAKEEAKNGMVKFIGDGTTSMGREQRAKNTFLGKRATS